mmetsp:Transcript_23287/g.26811  ORF Transcript_23287/g.26811 Transcript_23287/m.26811 type:complete len:540 (+) Transcript_23287:81-1700(+)|eukprot:CAMPEP_0194369852 /NCGR_PEP_ID=MMETSP0174-20130528/18215_1 /TAXON_ID=216777 /ORGANISM="Proboscia alata, Strain PI-D3" /LENGTH=539 /DNA_ID=CAMNT_0039147049 /DNA_START=39 /DNA_END=1658 /DNA_ORIENTATION=-
MRVTADALSLLLLQCSLFTLGNAFIPISRSTSARTFAPCSFCSGGLYQRNGKRAFTASNLLDLNDGLDIRRSRKFSLRMSESDNSDDSELDDDDDDDDDDGITENPLSNAVDSVSWMDSISEQQKSTDSISAIKSGAEILPFFPLGGIVYTPNSEHELTIFEPRYRQMYNDILMNGSKRFVVSMAHPTEEGTFASVGVIFKLKELRDVSERTGDQYKYICDHMVTGRVKLHRVINPKAWETRETYLKVEGTILEEDDIPDEVDEDDEEDSGAEAAISSVIGKIAAMANPTASKKEIEGSAPHEEELLIQSFGTMVELMHILEEDVRFTRASVNSLGVSPGGGEDSLWSTIRLWQSYIQQRLNARGGELQKEFQKKVLKFLTEEKNLKESELPSAIGFTDLSPELQKEVQDLQKRMTVELQPLVLESTLTMQKILEGDDHKARVNLLRYFVDEERKRLEARKVLRGIFSTESTEDSEGAEGETKDESATAAAVEDSSEKPPDETKAFDEDSLKGMKLPELGEGSDKAEPDSFFDEPGAFQ